MSQHQNPRQHLRVSPPRLTAAFAVLLIGGTALRLKNAFTLIVAVAFAFYQQARAGSSWWRIAAESLADWLVSQGLQSSHNRGRYAIWRRVHG